MHVLLPPFSASIYLSIYTRNQRNPPPSANAAKQQHRRVRPPKRKIPPPKHPYLLNEPSNPSADPRYRKIPITSAIATALPASGNPVALRSAASPVNGMVAFVPLMLELPFAKA